MRCVRRRWGSRWMVRRDVRRLLQRMWVEREVEKWALQPYFGARVHVLFDQEWRWMFPVKLWMSLNVNLASEYVCQIMFHQPAFRESRRHERRRTGVAAFLPANATRTMQWSNAIANLISRILLLNRLCKTDSTILLRLFARSNMLRIRTILLFSCLTLWWFTFAISTKSTRKLQASCDSSHMRVANHSKRMLTTSN